MSNRNESDVWARTAKKTYRFLDELSRRPSENEQDLQGWVEAFIELATYHGITPQDFWTLGSDFSPFEFVRTVKQGQWRNAYDPVGYVLEASGLTPQSVDLYGCVDKSAQFDGRSGALQRHAVIPIEDFETRDNEGKPISGDDVVSGILARNELQYRGGGTPVTFADQVTKKCLRDGVTTWAEFWAKLEADVAIGELKADDCAPQPSPEASVR